MSLWLTALVALTFAAPGTTASVSPAVTAPGVVRIREWPVPWADTRPRDPAVAADGRVWFVGQVGNYVGVLEPKAGTFRRFALTPNALPHNIVVAADGDLWYAGNGDGHIGRLDAATGKLKRRYALPEGARDPHTMAFAPDGALWFTAQHGNSMGRLQPADGKVNIVRPKAKGSRPYGLVIDDMGRPWVALFGTNRIATVDPQSMRIREFTLPEGARPRRLEAVAGLIWYVDYARGYLGRLDPATGKVKEYRAPGGAGSQPYAMASDAQGRLWLVETGEEPNRLVGFDPRTETFGWATPIPRGGGTVRHMVYDARAHVLWFGTDANTIGRAELLDFP